MAEGLTGDLVLAGLTCGLAGYLVARQYLSVSAAATVVAIKVSLPVIYFAWFFDRQWTFLDDWAYFERTLEIAGQGYDSWTVLTTRAGLLELMLQARSTHVGYYWMNLLGHDLFGAHYWSPVFLNVLATFAGAYFLHRIAELCGASRGYSQGLALFYLLHWDILSWSSILNLKDIVLMQLTLLSLCGVVFLARGRTLSGTLLIGVGSGLLLVFRFYVPLLIVVAGILFAVLERTVAWHWVFLLLTCALGLTLHLKLSYIVHLSPGSLGYGIPRFFLTPQPWSLEPAYTFLSVPALLHWALAVPCLLGAVLLWRRWPDSRVLLIYGAEIWVLYAMFEGEQGPRHRLQVAFVLCWMQYHFFHWLLAEISRVEGHLSREPRPPTP